MISVPGIVNRVGKRYTDVKDEMMRQFLADYVDLLMLVTGGNKSKAAKLAGVDRSAWRRLMRKAVPRHSEEP